MPYKKIAGIYKIQSPSGKIYIGQSRNIHRRWSEHKYSSNKKKNMVLYRSICKYGFELHKFSIIHRLPKDVSDEVLTNYEQIYMDAYKDCGFELLNTAPAAGSTKGMLGKTASLETRIKQSIAHKGKKFGRMSESHKANLSKALKGTKASVGRILSEETKKKIANSLLGNTPWNKGKTGIYSEETRLRISNTLKGRKRAA